MQNLKEKWLVLSKMTWGIYHIFTGAYVRGSKNWDFDRVLLFKLEKYMSLKFTGEFCIMTMKNDTKYEEELTCQRKIDRNLTNFDHRTRKSQKFCTLIGCIWTKYIMVELKTSIEEFCLMALKVDAKFEGKPNCAF